MPRRRHQPDSPHDFPEFSDYVDHMRSIVAMLLESDPHLRETFYWGGSAPISCDELHHVFSLDVDLFTKREFASPRENIARLKRGLGRKLFLYERDDEFGIYRGEVTPPSGPKVALDIFSSVEDVRAGDLEPSANFFGLERVTLGRYLEDKLLCLESRVEAKDLYHVFALASLPGWQPKVEEGLKKLDPILLIEQIHSYKELFDRGELQLEASPATEEVSIMAFGRWLGETLQHLRPQNESLENKPKILPNRSFDIGGQDPGNRLGPSL